MGYMCQRKAFYYIVKKYTNVAAIMYSAACSVLSPQLLQYCINIFFSGKHVVGYKYRSVIHLTGDRVRP